jgi:hypothetical protein
MFKFMLFYCNRGGRDSSVGIAIGYGLDGPGIESYWDIFQNRVTDMFMSEE